MFLIYDKIRRCTEHRTIKQNRTVTKTWTKSNRWACIPVQSESSAWKKSSTRRLVRRICGRLARFQRGV